MSQKLGLPDQGRSGLCVLCWGGERVVYQTRLTGQTTRVCFKSIGFRHLSRSTESDLGGKSFEICVFKTKTARMAKVGFRLPREIPINARMRLYVTRAEPSLPCFIPGVCGRDTPFTCIPSKTVSSCSHSAGRHSQKCSVKAMSRYLDTGSWPFPHQDVLLLSLDFLTALGGWGRQSMQHSQLPLKLRLQRS